MVDEEIELVAEHSDLLRPQEDVLICSSRDIEHNVSDARPLLRASDDDGDIRAYQKYFVQTYYDEYTTIFKSWRKWLSDHWSLVITCAFVTALISVALMLFKTWTKTPHNKQTIGPSWKGFSNIENYFAFGDSWTTTRFIVEAEQPSSVNPIGNPDFPGLTSTNGINYVGYLGTKYNHSFVKIFDFAWGGSTIDAGIDRTLFDWLDLAHQIKDEFVDHYTRKEAGTRMPRGWTSENSLFSTFFGINDVIVYDRRSHEIGHVFATYERLIGDLYDTSARNFLVINIPPVNKSPGLANPRPFKDQKALAAKVDEFNGRIKVMVSHLRKKYKDITIFEYDVHDLFERITTNPQSVPQTTGYKDTERYCSEYEKFENGTSATEKQIQLCQGLDVEEYLWLNSIHTTSPVHSAIAAEIEMLLLRNYTR